MKFRNFACVSSLLLASSLYGGEQLQDPIAASESSLNEQSQEPAVIKADAPAPAVTKPVATQTRGKLLGYVKIGPLKIVLDKYLKFLNDISPEYSSTVELMTMGILGGKDCPGISTRDNVGVFFFPNLKEGCSIVVLFKAQPNAHIVKILREFQDFAFEDIQNSWYLFCNDKTMAKGVRRTVEKLVQFLDKPQTTDISVQAFDELWRRDNSDSSTVKTDIATHFDTYKILEPIVEEIASIGLSLTLDDSVTRVALEVKSKPNTALSIYLSKPTESAPIKAAQWLPKDGPMQIIGNCETKSSTEYLNAIIERINENLKHNPKLTENLPGAIAQFLLSKKSTLDQYLSLYGRYSDDSWASCSWMNQTATKELKGRTVSVYTGQWSAEETSKFYRSLFEESFPQWTVELTQLLEKSNAKTQPNQAKESDIASVSFTDAFISALKGMKYEHKEKVFEQDGVSVNWVSMCCVTPENNKEKSTKTVFDEQSFIAVADGNLLCASTREDMEKLIPTVLGKNEKTNSPEVFLPAGCLIKGDIDLMLSKLNFSLERQQNQLTLKADCNLKNLILFLSPIFKELSSLNNVEAQDDSGKEQSNDQKTPEAEAEVPESALK